MATSENAKIQIESGQTLHDFAVMEDVGDHKVHNISGGELWSGKAGFAPDIRPNGMITGLYCLSPNAANDTVTIAAFTAYSKGVLHQISATDATFTRPTGPNKAKVISITLASDGSIAKVAGPEGASATFSETRGANGGPPYIPVNSVEIGQIRVTASTPGVLTTDEIFQVINTHTERYNFPVWEQNNVGEGDGAAAGKDHAFIEFASALPLIHTAGVAKKVFIQYHTPLPGTLSKAKDFKPAENTHSVSSEQVYRATIASKSSSLGQGGFTALVDDGVTGILESEQDELITVWFYPDENKAPYVLTQGYLGMVHSYPADNQNKVEVTITSEVKSARFSS